jgi:hypothetical protein
MKDFLSASSVIIGLIGLAAIGTITGSGGVAGQFAPSSGAVIILLTIPFAAILLVAGVVFAFSSPKDFRTWIILLSTIPFNSMVLYELYYPVAQRREDRRIADEKAIQEWQSLGSAINPLLREYYQTNPNKFQFPFGDDEAKIQGFSTFLESRGISLKRGKLIDPWGEPLHFVVDHDNDSFLRARKETYGVYNQVPDKVAVALILDDPNHVQSSNWQWAIGNGYIPKSK